MTSTNCYLPAFLILCLCSCSSSTEEHVTSTGDPASIHNTDSTRDADDAWNESQLSWLSYDGGINKLKTSGRNGLLVIYADWCPACKEYSTLFNDHAVTQALQGVPLIRSNADEEPDISARFDLDGSYVPRTFALDSSGRVIQELKAGHPEFQDYLPSDDPAPLIQFINRLKQYK